MESGVIGEKQKTVECSRIMMMMGLSAGGIWQPSHIQIYSSIPHFFSFKKKLFISMKHVEQKNRMKWKNINWIWCHCNIVSFEYHQNDLSILILLFFFNFFSQHQQAAISLIERGKEDEELLSSQKFKMQIDA